MFPLSCQNHFGLNLWFRSVQRFQEYSMHSRLWLFLTFQDKIPIFWARFDLIWNKRKQFIFNGCSFKSFYYFQKQTVNVSVDYGWSKAVKFWQVFKVFNLETKSRLLTESLAIMRLELWFPFIAVALFVLKPYVQKFSKSHFSYIRQVEARFERPKHL